MAILEGTSQYYIHPDHLDTPRVVTNAANTIVWRWDSDPFGFFPAAEDPDGNSQLFTLNLRFPGQYFDKETNLHYNYFRDYDPQTGRYIQNDPVTVREHAERASARLAFGAVPQDLASERTPYSYAASSPLRWLDPDGRAALGAVLAGFGADAMTPDPSDAMWPKWAGWGIATVAASLYDLCRENASDEHCRKEKARCSEICADAQSNPDARHVYGGSMAQCMRNCLPEECGGEPKWKGYR